MDQRLIIFHTFLLKSMSNLFVQGRFVAYKQGMRVTHNQTSILTINNVLDRDAAKYYLGKRVAVVYPKSQKVVYGKITKLHGNNGAVEAHFQRNLCAEFLGCKVQVMLYPQSE